MKEKLKNNKLLVVVVIICVIALAVIIGKSLKNEDDVLATIGNEKITKDDLYEVLEKQYGSTALDTLINNKIVELEAEKEKITVSDKEVKEELNNFIADYGGEDKFNAALESSNVSLSDFKKDVENFKKIEKLLEPSIKITDDEMKTYFEQNKENFNQAAQVEASHILVEDEATVNEVEKKLAAGEDFAELAKTYSKDTSNAENGGQLGYFGAGEMLEPFEKAAFAMKVGEISKPVKTDYGYHIIKVTGKKEAKTAVYEDHKDEIKKALFDEKVNSEYPTWLAEKKEKYKIKNNLEK
ncbi:MULTISPECIES: peptidylprolyl isomerase [Bacillus]|uniref:peptidylprolyl isomerase n=1 Tax=Bacillus TaxID=1386 RepID=UPI0002EB7422|nr:MULTISPECIES: peptidylprolyl isomerase [Bacillus]